ncbi:MAG TPA: polysaccharide biosynthesis C-terminal domain-containing protein, partial [Bacteroidia bacterium]|nr:polysaccharide biosynthesis C-terminal domain-containing protein [Bacteroidia bacterium]
VTVLMLIYVFWLGHLNLKVRMSWRMRKLFKRILVYGGFTFLGNLSAITLYTIDGIMLAAYVGMKAVGIYTTSFYVTALIMIPWRAIQKVASPQVSEHWRSGDMAALDRLYKRTSLINTGIGSYLYIVMIIGMDLLFSMMPDDFGDGQSVLIIVGATRLLDMMTGLNGYIMLTSKYYRMDIVLNLAVVGSAITLNLWLIPIMGIMGAALATAIALGISNVLRVGFIWWKLGMHPFTKEMLYLSIVSVIAFMGQWILPDIGNVWTSFIFRTTIFSVLFVVPVSYFDLIPDANRLLGSIRSKIKR